MKTLPLVGWSAVMLVLLGGAFVLPKFVQRTREEPTPKEDLFAALAVVGSEGRPDSLPEPAPSTAPEPAGAPVSPPPLPPELEDPRFDKFKDALSKLDFAAASGEVTALAGSLDAPTLAALTKTMEHAVQELEKTPPPQPASVSVTESDPAPESKTAPIPGPPPDPLAASPETPLAPATPPSWDSAEFFAKLGTKDFPGAEAELASAKDTLPAALHAGLTTQLNSAREMERQLADSRRELEESRRRTEEAQEKSLSRMETSVQELSKATAAAQLAAQEAQKLRVELTQMREATPPPAAAPPLPLKAPQPAPPPELPAQLSIAFGFDSSLLAKAESEKLAAVVDSLKKEPRLTVQLRGYADKSGDAAYNAMLSQARAESIKDELLKAGLEEGRIGVLSFGESQAALPGARPEDLRKVDVVFRARN